MSIKMSFWVVSSPKASEGLQYSGSSSHTSYQLYDLPKGVRVHSQFGKFKHHHVDA